MKPKPWLVFGVIQAAGMMAAFSAVKLQFPSMWLASSLLLLPGSLASIALSWPSHIGANWSPWVLVAIAALANIFLFIIISFLRSRYRKPKSVATEA
jgi:hypothetical protein